MNKPASLVVRDDGVAGSNPATPTSFRTDTCTDMGSDGMDIEQRMYAANRTVREYGGPAGDHPEWRKLLEEAYHLQRKWEIKRKRAAHCPHCGRPFA